MNDEPRREGSRRARWAAAARDSGDLRAGGILLAALVVAGPLLGLLWAAVAPRLDVAAGISGSETAFATQSGVDATFGFICLGAGIVAGAIARWRAPEGGWPVAVGLAAGGIGGSLLAGWVGHLVRSPDVLDQLPPGAGSYVVGLVDMKVRAHGLYLVLPAAALFVLALSLWLPYGWAGPPRRGHAGPAAADAPDEAFASASAFRSDLLPDAAQLPPSQNGAHPAQVALPPPEAATPGTAAPPASGDLERPA